ncbi:MAG: hypothetical protein Kow009_03120 [Spirochaetales bacterium]
MNQNGTYHGGKPPGMMKTRKRERTVLCNILVVGLLWIPLSGCDLLQSNPTEAVGQVSGGGGGSSSPSSEPTPEPDPEPEQDPLENPGFLGSMLLIPEGQLQTDAGNYTFAPWTGSGIVYDTDLQFFSVPLGSVSNGFLTPEERGIPKTMDLLVDLFTDLLGDSYLVSEPQGVQGALIRSFTVMEVSTVIGDLFRQVWDGNGNIVYSIYYAYADQDVRITLDSQQQSYGVQIDITLKAGWNRIIETWDNPTETYIYTTGAEHDDAMWVFQPQGGQ